MQDTAGFFKATIKWDGRQAIIGIAENSAQGWWLIKDTGWWIKKPGCQKGTWSQSMKYTFGEQGDFTHCLNGDGSGVLFRLKDVSFPPDPENNANFFYKGFFFGDYWSANDSSIPKLRNSSMTWQPIVTDMLLAATIAKFNQIQDEIIQMGIQAGLDTTSILDPTGVLSAASAAYALRHGDYLGCGMSLLGIIPVVGKACEIAKVGQASGRLARLSERLRNLMEVIKSSGRVTREMRLEGTVVREELQGATDLAKVTRESAGVGKMVTAGADIAREAEKGGMAVQDAKSMQEFTVKNNAIACVRYTAKESQARLGDVLNDGKPCELAPYHTAHADSTYSGYIVVRKEQMATLTYVDKQGVTRLKNLSPEYKVMDHACPTTGDRLITRNGIAYYSDYDFMGMYHGSTGSPYLDFKDLNDNPGIVSFVSRMFPAFGNKVQHGMQDFFIKVNGTMGRQPKLDETFLFFEPNGKVSYVDLLDLRRLYAKYKIKWPYEVFNKTDRIRVLTSTTQAVMSATRASQAGQAR